MRILVVGAGAVGFHLARELDLEGHEVFVLDRDAQKVEQAQSRLDVKAMVGSGLRLRSLADPDALKAELLIATTDSDEVNVLSCQIARRLGIPRQIARLQSEEVAREFEGLDPESIGVDEFVHPQRVTVDRLRSVITSVGTTDSNEFAKGRIVLRSLPVLENVAMAGRSLRDLASADKVPFVVAAIRRGKELIVPRGDTSIERGDTVYVILRSTDLESFLDDWRFPRLQARRVLVFGAEEIGCSLCEALEGKVRDLILIDPRLEYCNRAAERLSSTAVVHGSPLDQGLLQDLKISRSDYFLALSRADGGNLAAALMAKRLGVRTNVALTAVPEHVELFEPLEDLDMVTCPASLSVGAILRAVRTGRVIHLSKIGGWRGEALEIEVQLGSGMEDRALKDVNFPTGAVVAAVWNAEGAAVARGDTRLRAGDHAVVVSRKDAVPAVIEIFADARQGGRR